MDDHTNDLPRRVIKAVDYESLIPLTNCLWNCLQYKRVLSTSKNVLPAEQIFHLDNIGFSPERDLKSAARIRVLT